MLIKYLEIKDIGLHLDFPSPTLRVEIGINNYLFFIELFLFIFNHFVILYLFFLMLPFLVLINYNKKVKFVEGEYPYMIELKILKIPKESIELTDKCNSYFCFNLKKVAKSIAAFIPCYE